MTTISTETLPTDKLANVVQYNFDYFNPDASTFWTFENV